MTDEERKALLSAHILGAIATGWVLREEGSHSATMTKGKPVNHVLHAILTFFTCFLWGFIWLIVACTGGRQEATLVVDHSGQVFWR